MKALIVGGNSGLGLSLTLELLKRNYEKIYIIGKDKYTFSNIPEELRELFSNKVIFKRHNFVNFDITVFDDINDIDTLIITAGFGRLSLFESLSFEEVNNLLKVDLEAPALILKRYYEKIASKKDFFASIIVSICGQIVSPFFSVYGAAKGGLRFLVENLNCELESNGYKNRILDASPGSLKGTSFSGGGTDVKINESIAVEIVDKMMNRETLFIPEYRKIYKQVIERYQSNPHKFGLESYQYKVKSGRLSNKPQVTVGYLSGTFDLFHIGHLNLLKRAKEECDYLIVGVHNSGAWKGKETYIPFEERCEILKSIKYVDKVVESPVEDSDAWDLYHYDKLFVGSDYYGTERFNRYEKILDGKAKIMYFPYTKSTSSTQLREAIRKQKN